MYRNILFKSHPSSFKLLLFLLLHFHFAHNYAFAQNWDWQNPLPQGVNLFSVHFPNDTIGYTVGMDGTILKTTNGGSDWFHQESGVLTTFSSVFFTHADTGYAVGYANTIHKTTNGGANWLTISNVPPALTDVFFVNANTGYAVGSNGSASTIFKTQNGGYDWVVQQVGTVTFYNTVFFVNDSTGYVAGGGGKILKTTDGGDTWINQISGTTQTITSLYFIDALNGYGVSDGRILKTTNGGTTWTSQTIFQANELYSVKFTDANTGYVVGRSGDVLKTTNAGSSWAFLNTETNITLRSVYFTDTEHGVAVGESGIVLKTNDAGLNWLPFSSSEYYEDLNDSHFINTCHGFAVGDNGTILKTNNGGAQWIAQSSDITNHLAAVHFTSVDVGYAVGNAGFISKTLDGGTTWLNQMSGLNTDLKDVYFTNTDTGYVVGGSGNILKTTDGGINWVNQMSNVTNNLTAIHFVDANLGFVVGSGGRLLKTINGGITWNVLFSGTSLDLTSVFFPTAQIGYIAGVSGHIRKTTNGGTNWTQQTNNINIALTSLAFIDANNGYAAGYDYNRYGKIYHTTNGGTNWSVETISWDHDLNAVKYVDANTVYLVGNNGAILKSQMVGTTATNTGPVCAGEIISLSTTSIAGASYLWSGPNNFTSTDQNPTIANTTTSMSGDYTVLICLGACINTEETTTLIVNETPEAPLIVNTEPLCVGDTLLLSTIGLTNAIYAWSGPNEYSSNEQNPLVSNQSDVNMAGTYAVSQTWNNCTSETTEITIEINPIPNAPIITSASSFCVGSSSTLTTPTLINANYYWTGPNEFVSTEQNPLLSDSSTLDLNGTYHLMITIDGCSSPTAVHPLLVYERPDTPNIFHDEPICAGSPFSLSTESVANASYSWVGPNGFTSDLQNPLVNGLAEVAMSGLYTLTTTVNNCTSAPNESQVAIIAIPETPVIENNNPLCVGALASLTTPYVAETNYWWTGPNDFISSEQNPILSTNATLANGGIYSLTLTTNGCSSLASTTELIVFENPPTPNINLAPICEGTPFVLHTAEFANADYTWSGPNRFSSSDQNPLIGANATLEMSGTYTLTIAVNGCSSDTSEAVVEIEQSPEPPNVNNNSPLCAGLELSLSAASDPGAIYLWTGPNGFTSQEQNPIVSPSSTSNESGNYEVVATIGNCTSTSAATWVIVHPIPDAPIATSNAPIDEGSILSLMSSSVAEANYLWTGPNGFTSNEQNPTVSTNASMPMAGLYAVQVMVNGCLSDFSSVSVQINEANTIDDSNVNSSVRIYPNPAHDQLSLELLGEGFKNVEIVNALGSVVLRQYISQKKMNLNIASIAPGLYIIVLQGEGLRVEEKIFKY